MPWKKDGNEAIFIMDLKNDFQILSEEEKLIILSSNPDALLSKTFDILDKAYRDTDNDRIKVGLQRLEGLMQLDFIQSDYMKIRTLLSLYFGYHIYKNSKTGRFKTYVDWDSFSSHCKRNFPAVSNFKGKTFSSIHGIIKLFLSLGNNATVKGYAEIKGWYSESEYHYFEDGGILDYAAGMEADKNAVAKNSDTTSKSVILLIFAAIMAVAFFMPTYNFGGAHKVSGFSALFDTGIFFNADNYGSTPHWHLMIGSLIALTYGFYAINLLVILTNFKTKIFFIFAGILLYGSIFLFGYEWYSSGSFTSFFHQAGLGFYLGSVGAGLFQTIWLGVD